MFLPNPKYFNFEIGQNSQNIIIYSIKLFLLDGIPGCKTEVQFPLISFLVIKHTCFSLVMNPKNQSRQI